MSNFKKELSVQEALREVKLTEAKLHRNLQTVFVTAKAPSEVTVGGMRDLATFNSNAKSTMQSTRDLINRYHDIKNKIAESNAVTRVTVAGKSMTVAAAIEYKSSLRFEQSLLSSLQLQAANAVRTVALNERSVTQQAEQAANAFFGATAKDNDKRSSAEYQTFVKDYIARHKHDIIDPVESDVVIKELQSFIEEFLAEVDNVLTLSNVETKIILD